MSNDFLRLESFALCYNGKWIIRPSNEVFPFVGVHLITGENGAGKTSFLRSIIGINRRYFGSIFWGDKALNEIRASSLAKHVPFLGQSLFPVAGLTVGQFLMSTLSQVGQVESELLNQPHFFFLNPIWAREISSLSGGEWRRVQLARLFLDFEGRLLRDALIQPLWAPVMVLDEPTSFLDAHSKRQLFRALAEMGNQYSVTFFISTHDFEFIDFFKEHAPKNLFRWRLQEGIFLRER